MSPNTSKLSRFLKAEHCKDGDVINFMDAGIISDKEFERNGKKETNPVLELTVEINGERKVYSPNSASRGFFEEAWGFDTEKWISKQARITIAANNFGKKTILAKPI